MKARDLALLVAATSFGCGWIVEGDGAPGGSAQERCEERTAQAWAIIYEALDAARVGCATVDECSVLPPLETICLFATCGGHAASDTGRHLVDAAVREANALMCVDDPGCWIGILPCVPPDPHTVTRLVCEAGECLLVDECDPTGCPGVEQGVPCCVLPDGECGADLGEGCVVEGR